MKTTRNILLGILGFAIVLWAIDIVGDLNVLGTLTANIVDFTNSTSTAPMKTGTTLPATCSVGQSFFKTDATAGQNIYLCTATNTWTQVQGGGGGGSSACVPGDLRYVCWQDDFMGATTSSGQIGLLGWSTFGNGSLSNIAGEWPYVGIVRLTTGTTSGNMFAMSLSGGGPAGNLFANDVRDVDVKFVFRLNSPSDSNFRVMVSNINTSNGSVHYGFGVGKDSSGNFALYYGVAGEQSTTASFGVAVDSNWHTVRFYTDPLVNQRVYVTLDNTVTRTACPSGCNLTANSPFSYTQYNIAASVITNTAAARSLDIDLISFKAVVGTDSNVR